MTGNSSLYRKFSCGLLLPTSSTHCLSQPYPKPKYEKYLETAYNLDDRPLMANQRPAD